MKTNTSFFLALCVLLFNQTSYATKQAEQKPEVNSKYAKMEQEAQDQFTADTNRNATAHKLYQQMPEHIIAIIRVLNFYGARDVLTSLVNECKKDGQITTKKVYHLSPKEEEVRNKLVEDKNWCNCDKQSLYQVRAYVDKIF